MKHNRKFYRYAIFMRVTNGGNSQVGEIALRRRFKAYGLVARLIAWLHGGHYLLWV
ncbi:MAG: hypothetical protein ACYDIC_07305 [Desulfobaccales bacterium]